MTTVQIAVDGASRSFQRRDKSSVKALNDVSFEVEAGEFLVLLGPSGCGKSTLLRTLAGLEQLDRGVISLAGRTVVDIASGVNVPTESRRLSMMFQSYALWPHMTVAQNVAYPLKARKIKGAAINTRVKEALEQVGIGELASQYPGQISGGQAQRVALARALVSRDDIVLFDEPLSNVDAKVREHLRTEITRLHTELGFTAVYVTHDQEEALTMATRIFVMKAGQISQAGSAQEIYDHPNSRYVAQFLGSVNEMVATYVGAAQDGLSTVDSPVGRLTIDYPESRDGHLTVFTRPEAWKIGHATGPTPGDGLQLTGVVSETVFLGSVSDIKVRVGSELIVVRSIDRELAAGDEVTLSIEPRRMIGRSDAANDPENITGAEPTGRPAPGSVGAGDVAGTSIRIGADTVGAMNL